MAQLSYLLVSRVSRKYPILNDYTTKSDYVKSNLKTLKTPPREIIFVYFCNKNKTDTLLE